MEHNYLVHPDRPPHPSLVRLRAHIRRLSPLRLKGRVRRIHGPNVTVAGLESVLRPGALCRIHGRAAHPPVLAEVLALEPSGARLLAYEDGPGLELGAEVEPEPLGLEVYPHPGWCGRVLDALGQPLDEGGPLPEGDRPYRLQRPPPPPHKRRPLGPRLATGVRALDLFVPCCEGQRLGIFAGSGVGKSTLLAMLARGAEADVIVLALIGERGRELQLFLHEVLGEDGLKRSVVVAATSDEPAMRRRRAALLSMTIAEYFRDRGLRVLYLFDSVTRYAMALREIHLAAGELPASRGYPPSVFAELPRLLERPGTCAGPGSITAFFSVLVEGDDFHEPITDTVRGTLDGHLVLDRTIAERGRFPAVNVLKSLSRTAPGCYREEEREAVQRARRLLAVWEEMAELVDIGAYKPGANPELDEALRLRPKLEALLHQDVEEPPTHGDPFRELQDILDQAAGAESP